MKYCNRLGYIFLIFVSLFTLVGCNFIANTYERDPDYLSIKKNSSRYRIMGKGVLSEKTMLRYLLEHNRKIRLRKAEYIVRAYMWEALCEGVNHDVAFAQMCQDTDFLHFKGAISAQQNNFCGLGTLSDARVSFFFSDIRTGIRAHIQHLKAYGSSQNLTNRCVDPRFTLVRRSTAVDIFELAGKWTLSKDYGNLLKRKIDTLIDMENAFRQKE